MKEKIKNWFKDRYNIAFAVLFALILIYKIYWFVKVGNQPLWFDEADYMSTAKSWLGIADYAFNPLRPILFTMIAYCVFGLGLGEVSMRILVLLISLASVPLVYAIGSKLFDKRAGLISAFIMGIFWSWTFYTYRLLVDVPLGVLWLATIYFFFDAYYGDKGWKSYLVAGIFLGLSFLMKFSSVALVLIFAVYLLATERLAVFKNKKIWVFYLTSLVAVLPYFIWQKVKFGSPFAFFSAASAGVERTRSFYQSLIDQTLFSFGLLKSMLVVVIILGIAYLLFSFVLVIGNTKNKHTKTNRIWFLIAWIAGSLLFFGWLNYGNYMDERYYFVFYPALFIVAGSMLVRMYDFGKKYSKYISLAIIAIVLIIAAYQNNTQAKSSIEGRVESFIQPKDAGEWIKSNTLPGEKVISTQENPEIQYYAEREIPGTWAFNSSKELDAFIERENVNYLILAIFYPQNMKQWEYEYFSNNSKIVPVRAYPPYIDQAQKVPIITIFRVIRVNAQNASVTNSLLG